MTRIRISQYDTSTY